MITDKEIVLLQGLTDARPIAVKVGDGQTTLLHAEWFVLELPTGMFRLDLKSWKTKPLAGALTWRKLLPEKGGAYGQPIRKTAKDGKQLIQLIADTGVAYIHASIYDVVTKQLTEPEFRVFPEAQASVGILSGGTLRGGVGQVTL